MSWPPRAPWLGDPEPRGAGGAEVPHATASATTTRRALRVDEMGKPVFEFPQSHIVDLQGQVEVGRDVSSLVGKPRSADQPVGEEERPRFGVRDLFERSRAGEHLIAVRPGHTLSADLVEQRLELAPRPAIAVDDDELGVVGAQPMQLLAQLVDDARGIQVQHRRQPIDVHIPAATVDDVLHLAPERPADHQRGRAHETVSSCGKPSTEMNESLKSVRPDSSTYSMRDGNSKATCRSRYDRSAILAPSPAELPTAMMRSTSTGGTSPMTLALSGFR